MENEKAWVDSIRQELRAATRALTLTIAPGDGRLDSANHEEVNMKLLAGHFENHPLYHFVEPKAREWYDFIIEPRGESYLPFYCNIKSSDVAGGRSDNISSVKGMCYGLTGKIPEKKSPKELNKLVKTQRDYTTPFDYQLLVVDKNTNEVHLTSLLALPRLTVNGNNPPFQCGRTT